MGGLSAQNHFSLCVEQHTGVFFREGDKEPLEILIKRDEKHKKINEESEKKSCQTKGLYKKAEGTRREENQGKVTEDNNTFV